MNWHPSRALEMFRPPCGQHSAGPLGYFKFLQIESFTFPLKSLECNQITMFLVFKGIFLLNTQLFSDIPTFVSK